ncbi:MAG: PKD domain-containing protein [Saprospiraceae bacterium]
MKNIFPIISFVIVLLFSACEPQQDDAIDLTAVPTNVSFTVTASTTETNVFTFKNTTSETFLYHWDFGNGETATGEEVEAYFPFMGDYDVTLKAFNDGGFGIGTQSVNVAEDDDQPCAPGSLTEFLTGCDEQGWILLQDAGAYWVGPNDGSGDTWWSNPADDVTTRYCAFDDEWIFNTALEVVYDSKGDLWAEDYMGFSFECVTDDQLTGAAEAWKSATHTYQVIEGTPEQLKLVGLGAFMGLPKATNDGELTGPDPASTITYDIIDRGEDANGKYMELEVNFGGGLWRFKYVSN